MNPVEFQNWAIDQGIVCKHENSGGGICGECVSLINQFCWRVLNVPAMAWGHAWAWGKKNPMNPYLEPYFDIVGSPQPWDIGVQDQAMAGNPYGHIFIYIGNGQILEQNGAVAGRVSISPMRPATTILRRKGSTPVGGDVEPLDQDRINRLWLQFLGHAPSQDDINAWAGKKTWDLIGAMLNGAEWAAYEKKVADALAGGQTATPLKPGVYKVN